MSHKNVPIGISSFSKLVDPSRNYCFVDKSLFIMAILDDKSEATLITRPRRWGKTLNMSMLQHFLAIEIPNIPTENLFRGLQIEQVDGGRYMQHNRQYPVIFISFKDIKSTGYSHAVEHIESLLKSLFADHACCLLNSTELNENDKKRFNHYANDSLNQSELQDALLILSKLLFKHYGGEKVYILIDEYDSPLNSAYEYGYIAEMIVFMKNLLSAALKDNPCLEKGVMTGILRLSKDSMLSGLNNLKVSTILNQDYAPYFGFSEQEVENLFLQQDLPYKMDQVREYYNGYEVGDTTCYNPWSVINCLGEAGRLEPYWVNTSDDNLLKKTLLNSGNQVKEQLQSFFLDANKKIEASISETTRFEGLPHDESALWSLLLATGYLTARCKQRFDIDYFCELKVPNEEVRKVYLHIFRKWLQDQLSEANYQAFMRDLLFGRVDLFTQKLENYLLTYGTGHEFKEESNYHTFLLGLLAGLSDFYELYSNAPAGFGRADLMLVPKRDHKTAIILELKHTKAETVDKKLALTALEQIDRKRYDQFMQRYQHLERVLKIGIAFANRTAVSCYRWEDAKGTPDGEAVSHQSFYKPG